jgi:arsenite methyltransferase
MRPEAKFWNGAAEKYSRKPVGNPQAFERKIDITRSRLTAQSIVLDIGCGTGSLALRLAPSAGHVHGLDVSSEMVRIASGKAQAEQVENVTFHTAAFDDSLTAFADGSFDGICAYSVLHLLEDPAAGLQRIHRLLKPGGFLVSSTVCLGESWVPFGALLRVMRWIGKAPPVRIFTKRALEEAVGRAGFAEISQPDVGAESTVAFLVATKPAQGSTAITGMPGAGTRGRGS